MLCYNCMREKGDSDVCPHCHAQNIPEPMPHHLMPGTVVGGRYVVGRTLGEGGFGITYIGCDQTLEIPVAIKEYFPFGYSNRVNTLGSTVTVSAGEKRAFYDRGKTRFLQEAKNIAKFKKEPGIVDVTDFIEENGTAYIVMEYLDGIDLRRYLRQYGMMTPEEAFRFLMPAMRSLEKVHRVGIIHRDVSPDNIMVLNDGTVKLMDFGAARDFDGENRSMSVMLKPGYAPEEQYRRNGEQGPWTDVYGMCATIYRCITGKTPDDSINRLFEDHLKKPSQLGVVISPEVEDVLMYGLAVRKSDRCPDMTVLIREMTRAIADSHDQPVTETEQASVGEDEYKTVPADTVSGSPEPVRDPAVDQDVPDDTVTDPAEEPVEAEPDVFKTVAANTVAAAPSVQQPSAPEPDRYVTAATDEAAIGSETQPVPVHHDPIPITQPEKDDYVTKTANDNRTSDAFAPIPTDIQSDNVDPVSESAEPKKKKLNRPVKITLISVIALALVFVIVYFVVLPAFRPIQHLDEIHKESVSRITDIIYDQYYSGKYDYSGMDYERDDDYSHAEKCMTTLNLEDMYIDLSDTLRVENGTDLVIGESTQQELSDNLNLTDSGYGSSNQKNIGSSDAWLVFDGNGKVSDFYNYDSLDGGVSFSYEGLTEKSSVTDWMSTLCQPYWIMITTETDKNSFHYKNSVGLYFHSTDLELSVVFTSEDEDELQYSHMSFWVPDRSSDSDLTENQSGSSDYSSYTAEERFITAQRYVEDTMSASVIGFSDYKIVSEGGEKGVYQCLWEKESYTPLSGFPFFVVVEDYSIEVGKTTMKDLLDNGFDYYNHSTFPEIKKNSRHFMTALEPGKEDDDSGKLAMVYLYGNTSEYAEYNYLGLTRGSSMEMIISTIGAPEKISVHSSDTVGQERIDLLYTNSDQYIQFVLTYNGESAVLDTLAFLDEGLTGRDYIGHD